ncbi:restriction endonuclease [Microvirga vignae]|uniref:restriction endonuclease n=1 Tax=Microvirga vignae TaxID=1225564 RepID=UPI000699EA84|nr:restriction endonuclease [Microvirga vignae]
MNSLEAPEQEYTETPEQRQERLKQIAKARVERLAAGDVVVRPHLTSEGIRNLSEIECSGNLEKSATAQLLEDGILEFPIRTYNVVVKKDGEVTHPHGRILSFNVELNDVKLDDQLICYTRGGNTSFSIKAPEPYAHVFRDGKIRNPHPLAVLRRLIEDELFPAYFEALISERFQAYQTLKRIYEEAERFRDVLIRKYRQLTYIDEYETLEATRFKDELKRFAEKRLHDIPTSVAVDIVFGLVLIWVSDEDSSSEQVPFDPGMSPIDYERFCAERFTAIGWATRLTKTSGDQGADIICEANQKRLVVQCKLYSGSVGNAAVQEIIAAREYEYADLAAVVSNAPFTVAAKELASAASVLLLHHDEIGSVLP